MIFVDTSFWVALMRPLDACHPEAVELFRRYGDRRLVTTNHVRGETWTFLRRRMGHRLAVQFLDFLQPSARLSIVHASAEIEERAETWLRRRDEREYSFVDATSFEVMRARGIADVLAFDGDFAAAGFNELRL